MKDYKVKEYGSSLYINTDSIKYMEELKRKGKKVACVITDPPYGINHKSNRRKDKNDTTTSSGILNDIDNGELLKTATDLYYDLLNDNGHIYFFTKWNKVFEHANMLGEKFNVKNIIIWDKGNHGSGDLQGAYGNRYEVVIYAMKGRRTFNKIDNRVRHPDILSIDNFKDKEVLGNKDKELIITRDILQQLLAEMYGLDPTIIPISKIPHKFLYHPHQKPLDLLTIFIKKSTNEGEVILDGFAGVGSTLIAAEKLKRPTIAIELSESVFATGCNYIEEELEDL